MQYVSLGISTGNIKWISSRKYVLKLINLFSVFGRNDKNTKYKFSCCLSKWYLWQNELLYVLNFTNWIFLWQSFSFHVISSIIYINDITRKRTTWNIHVVEFYTPTLIFRSLHLFICAVYNNNVLWLTFLNTLWQDYISLSTSSSFTTSTNNDSVNSTNFSMQWRQQFITNTSYYYCKCPNFEVTYVKLMFRCLLNTFRTISRSVS